MVDGAPVVKFGLERCFDFPVLDEVLHKFGKRAGFMTLLLRCSKSILKPVIQTSRFTHSQRISFVSWSNLVPFHIATLRLCRREPHLDW
jgi:hypothetical protein